MRPAAAVTILVVAGQATTAAADDDRRLQRAVEQTRADVDELLPLRRFLSAYVDVGFFAVAGDGSGVRADTGHRVFPELADRVPADWVLMGDPLATAINARGEPADHGGSRSLAADRIDSEGRPAALVNALGLRLARDVRPDLSIRAAVELLPRGDDVAIDLRIARVEYRPSRVDGLVLTAGKIDSVIGIEYRTQDAPERLTVTPSLLCRYTCGHPVGAQARLRRAATSAAIAVTAGDAFVDLVEPDQPVASDSLPTLSARLARRLPLGRGLELGASGSLGPQDGPPDAASPQWHLGADLHVRAAYDLELIAEYGEGEMPGATAEGMPECSVAPCLRYRVAYALGSWRARNWLMPYVRVDWRDARHQHGVEFAYITDVARATLGARLDLEDRAIVKVEYTRNHELGRLPQFPDDVFTASLVVRTE